MLFYCLLQMVSYEPGSPAPDTKEELMQGEEKLTALQLEYTHLLSSQLESQRHYFEAKITEAKADALREAEECRKLVQTTSEELDSLKTKYQTVLREKQTNERKVQQLSGKYTKVGNMNLLFII